MTNHYDFITKHLNNKHPYIVKFATIAAGITAHEVFISDLLNLLAIKRHRKRAIKSLKNYGPRIINVLLDLESKGELKSKVKKNIPKIVGAFQNENAVKMLLKILKSKDSTSRLEATKSLRKIKRKNSYLLW